jgi:hypothetical protein
MLTVIVDWLDALSSWAEKTAGRLSGQRKWERLARRRRAAYMRSSAKRRRYDL